MITSSLAGRPPVCRRNCCSENPDRWLRIPMFNAEARSLNLSNCVALVLFEALRQQGFRGEVRDVKREA